MRRIALFAFLLTLVLFNTPAFAQVGGSSGGGNTTEEEKKEDEDNGKKKPPPPPPILPGKKTNTNSSRPSSSVSSGNSGCADLFIGMFRGAEFRPGLYVGGYLQGGVANAFTVSTISGQQAITPVSSETGESFFTPEGEEITSSSTSSYGVTMGYRWPRGFSFQLGYNNNTATYYAINDLPYLSPVGQIDQWQLTSTFNTAHLALEQAFPRLIPKFKGNTFVRVAGHYGWYRTQAGNIALGTQDFRLDGTGVVFNNQLNTALPIMIVPEIGLHFAHIFQASMAYHWGLNDFYTIDYTHYDNNDVVAHNQLSINNSYFGLKLAMDISLGEINANKRARRITRDENPERGGTGEEPIEGDGQLPEDGGGEAPPQKVEVCTAIGNLPLNQVIIKDTVSVGRLNTVRLVFFDYRVQDNDMISACYNNDRLFEGLLLEKPTKKVMGITVKNKGVKGVIVNLQPGENVLRLLADNQGHIGPNTVQLEIRHPTSGVILGRRVLEAETGYSEGIVLMRKQ